MWVKIRMVLPFLRVCETCQAPFSAISWRIAAGRQPDSDRSSRQIWDQIPGSARSHSLRRQRLRVYRRSKECHKFSAEPQSYRFSAIALRVICRGLRPQHHESDDTADGSQADQQPPSALTDVMESARTHGQ